MSNSGEAIILTNKISKGIVLRGYLSDDFSKLKIIKIDEKWAKRTIKIAIKNDESIGKAGALLLDHLIS